MFLSTPKRQTLNNDYEYNISSTAWIALGPSIAFTAMVVLIVPLRIGTRLLYGGGIKSDDWVIFICLLGAIVHCVLTITECQLGFAYDGPGIVPQENTTTIAKLFLASNITYQSLIHLTKLSLLLQYLRLFSPATHPLTRHFCHLLICLVFCAACWGILGGVLICRPISRYWDVGQEGECRGARGYWISTGVGNVVLDLAVLGVPMGVVGAMRLEWRRKVGVMGLFGVGGVITVVSLLRLTLVEAAIQRREYTLSSAYALAWSVVESSLSVICSSAIALKPLFTHLSFRLPFRFPCPFVPYLSCVPRFRRPSRQSWTGRKSRGGEESYTLQDMATDPRSEAARKEWMGKVERHGVYCAKGEEGMGCVCTVEAGRRDTVAEEMGLEGAEGAGMEGLSRVEGVGGVVVTRSFWRRSEGAGDVDVDVEGGVSGREGAEHLTEGFEEVRMHSTSRSGLESTGGMRTEEAEVQAEKDESTSITSSAPGSSLQGQRVETKDFT